MSKLLDDFTMSKNLLEGRSTKETKEEIIVKRKDPKTMTMEELEEYLSKKKIKRSEREKDESKSLNSSFNSQKHINYSFNETNKIFNKLSENKYFMNDQGEKQKGSGTSDDKDHKDKEKDDQIVKPIFSNQILSSIGLSSKNPFLPDDKILQSQSQLKKSNNILYDLYSPRDKDNLTNISNMSIDQANYSDNEDNKRYKFNPKNVKQTDVNTSVSSSVNKDGGSLSNAMKALQDKIKKLSQENDTLKKSLIQSNESLDKERSEFNSKFSKEINKFKEIESNMQTEISDLMEANQDLNHQVNELKVQNSVLTTNLEMLEKEKGRHLEQNAADKEDMQTEIDNILQEFEQYKLSSSQLSTDYQNMKDRLTKHSDEKKMYEKTISALKEENLSIKTDLKNRLTDFNKEVDKLKKKFEEEREGLLYEIKALKDFIKQQDGEIKEAVKKYEKELKEARRQKNIIEAKEAAKAQVQVRKSAAIAGKERSRSKSGEKKLKVSSTSSTGNKAPSKTPLAKKSCNSGNLVNVERVKSPKNKVKKTKKSSHPLTKESVNFEPNYYDQYPVDRYQDGIDEEHYSNNMNNYTNESVSMYKNNNQKQFYPVVNNTLNNSSCAVESPLNANINEASLEQINEEIFSLERSIAETNRSYRNILTKINGSNNGEEISSLKRNQSLIAASLSEQTERLNYLKSQQKEIIINTIKH